MASIYTKTSPVNGTDLFPNLPQALSTYGSDSQMTSLLNQMDVFVLPVFNIDGYDYTHKTVSSIFESDGDRAVLFILKSSLIC